MIAGNNKHIFLNDDYINAFGENSIFDKLYMFFAFVLARPSCFIK